MPKAKVRQNPETKLYELVENGTVIATSPNPEDFRVPERRRSHKRPNRGSRADRPRNWRESVVEVLKLFPNSSAADVATLLEIKVSTAHHMLHDLEAEDIGRSEVIGGGRYRHIRRWRLA